jgi:hypothetical protein
MILFELLFNDFLEKIIKIMRNLKNFLLNFSKNRT